MVNKTGIKQHTSETSPSLSLHRKAKLTENRGRTPAREDQKHARIGSAKHLHPLNEVDLLNQRPEQAALAAKAEVIRTYVEEETILGQGSHASVKKGFDSASRSPVAIKKRLRQKEAVHAQTESSMLKVVQGIPHCLALRAAYDVPENEDHVIVTDYVEGEDLYKSHLVPNAPVGLLPLDHIISMGKQSLEALAHLRKIGVIHGDLKPENMTYLRQKRLLTILDWGCGIQIKEPVYLGGIMQTCYYRAPEVILGGPVDPSADLWSLAHILYEQFTGEAMINCADYLPDPKVSNNILLQKIAFQIGMPSVPFLRTCQEMSSYFKYEKKLEFCLPLDLQDTHWKVAIAQKGLERNLDADQIAAFTQLLEMMLQYDNRPHPEELLKLPIFKKDISIHITDLGSNAEAVIYRAEDVDAYLAYTTAIMPTPVLEFKKAKQHTCHHLPAPAEYIFCNKATPLSQGMKRVILLEDTTIDSSLFQDNVFLGQEPFKPMTDDDSLPQLFGGIADFL